MLGAIVPRIFLTEASQIHAVGFQEPSGSYFRLVVAMDACAMHINAETPLLEVTRTDAARYLIQLGLKEFAKSRPAPKRLLTS